MKTPRLFCLLAAATTLWSALPTLQASDTRPELITNGTLDAKSLTPFCFSGEGHAYSKSKIVASAPSFHDAVEIARENQLKIVTTYHAISALRNRWYGVFEKNDETRSSIESIIENINRQRPMNIAEPDYQASSFEIPNDPSFSKLWGLNKSNDCDIDAPEAWSINTGSSSVVVAVIDTGINYKHPDLAANMWINPREIPGNGIDDDNNGYIDDVYGINAIKNTGDPMDEGIYHGSHCAGTIGAVGNNGIGIVGVCWNVKMMALKFLNGSGLGESSNALKCLDYVIDQKQKGQNIVALNNSWGDLPSGPSLKDAIEACGDLGIIFVAAAGNGGPDCSADDIDVKPVYPASFTCSNIVAVGATSDLDKKCSFSNYGLTSVDLGAPGIGIYSTMSGSTYGKKNGTSMACPHVVGAFALVASEYPNESMAVRIKRILQSVDVIPALAGKWVTGGRLNVYKALLWHP